MEHKFKAALGQVATVLGEVEDNVAMVEEQCEQAIRDGAELILFPELALSGYSVGERFHEVSTKLNSHYIDRLRKMSRRIDICTGILEETENVEFYNSSIYLSGGDILHLHRKIYLPTYGRFDERRWFGQGRDVSAFDTRFGRMAMLICGDCWHLSLPYLAVQDGADVLLVMAASSKQGLAETIHPQTAWNSMNHSTALTMNSFVLFSNRAGTEGDLQFWGGSRIILPDGNVLAEGKIDEADLVFGEVDMSVMRRQRIILPFRRDDDLQLTLRLGAEILERKEQRQRAYVSSLPPSVD
jgi:predicted amidohydrolase